MQHLLILQMHDILNVGFTYLFPIKSGSLHGHLETSHKGWLNHPMAFEGGPVTPKRPKENQKKIKIVWRICLLGWPNHLHFGQHNLYCFFFFFSFKFFIFFNDFLKIILIIHIRQVSCFKWRWHGSPLKIWRKVHVGL